MSNIKYFHIFVLVCGVFFVLIDAQLSILRGRTLPNTNIFLTQMFPCPDADSDGICDAYDNCPFVSNDFNKY